MDSFDSEEWVDRMVARERLQQKRDAEWVHTRQLKEVHTVLDRLARHYNVISRRYGIYAISPRVSDTNVSILLFTEKRHPNILAVFGSFEEAIWGVCMEMKIDWPKLVLVVEPNEARLAREQMQKM